MRNILAIAGALTALCATSAQAETLRIAGVYPAASDDAVTVEAIAVERFSGTDGPALSFRMEDVLRGVNIEGRPWFTVLVPQRADQADAVLQGHAEPRFSESPYRGTRNACWRKGEDGECLERRDVETDCVRISMTFAPELRLTSRNGRVLWTSDTTRSSQFNNCPEYDDAPDFSAAVDGWIYEITQFARYGLAPHFVSNDIRIMESRRGLDNDTRDRFRDAIAMTERDEGVACDMFEALFAANPTHDSLTFNAGLCAEQAGAFDLAEERYRRALASDRSDDEATEGLERIDRRRRAVRQIAMREEALASRPRMENVTLPASNVGAAPVPSK